MKLFIEGFQAFPLDKLAMANGDVKVFCPDLTTYIADQNAIILTYQGQYVKRWRVT